MGLRAGDCYDLYFKFPFVTGGKIGERHQTHKALKFIKFRDKHDKSDKEWYRIANKGYRRR